jgi:hypothetical protein
MPPDAGHDEIGIGLSRGILEIVEIRHRLCRLIDAAGNGGDMILEHGSTLTIERSCIHFRQSCSAIQAPVMAAVRVPPSAWMTSQSTVIWRSPSSRQIDNGAQRAADQALDFQRAAALLAGGGLAAHAVAGRARQHAVFGRHPALAAPCAARRNPLFEAGGAQHMGVAELDQAGALGVFGHAALETDCPHLICFPARWTHIVSPQLD